MVLGRIKGERGAIGLLDIGTSKVACLVVAPDRAESADGRHRPDAVAGMSMLGFGLQRSRGVKAGVVVDLDEAERAVRAAVSQAERMAGTRLGEVHVAVACGRLRSLVFTTTAAIEAGLVNAGDLTRLLHAGRAYATRDGRAVVHLNRLAYRLDGAGGIADPRGMACATLEADFHAVTADDAPLRNLMLLIERCYLSTAEVTPAPIASALAVLTEEERRNGVTCIDMGAGTTSLAAFAEGNLLATDVVPVGGQHISFDIARTLSTPLEEAERIKTLYGTLVVAGSDEQEAISYSLAGSEEPIQYQVTRAQLRHLVQTRIEAMLALVGERLDRSGVRQWVGDRIVLTGGVSQTLGLADFVEQHLGGRARIARPKTVGGLSASIQTPAFATVVGLACALEDDAMREQGVRHGDGARYFGRMGQWLRESF